MSLPVDPTRVRRRIVRRLGAFGASGALLFGSCSPTKCAPTDVPPAPAVRAPTTTAAATGVVSLDAKPVQGACTSRSPVGGDAVNPYPMIQAIGAC